VDSSHSAEVAEKLARLIALLDQRQLDALILKKGANIAWAIGGRAHIPTTLELACMDLVITREGIEVVTNKIEAPRLADEELAGINKLTVINWFEGRDGQLPTSNSSLRVGIDGPDPERVNVAAEVELLRSQLNSYEVIRMREIAEDSAAALGAAMKEISSKESEVSAAGKIAKELWERDLEPVVLLVAGSERINRYRHPLPTSAAIGNFYMGVICARRKGLIASVTRLASFEKISAERDDWYQRLLAVERRFINASIPGKKLSEVFEESIAEYLAQGFDRDEWTNHHQGGPTGYLPRDFPAHSKSDRVISVNNALAWNPSAKGLKVEDTIITRVSEGPEVVSVDPKWPGIPFFERVRPAILQR
jgi:Xaa-Pro aminopeptidase